VLGFISVVSGIAVIAFVVRAAYGLVASDALAQGGPPDFKGLVLPYLIYAGVALVISILTHHLNKRI